MKINEKQQYHGPALAQIVDHRSFKALNRAGDGFYGHYLLNQETSIWMKYSTTSDEWRYTFSTDDLEAIGRDRASSSFIVLVCGHTSICCLTHDDLRELIDESASLPQWVHIQARPNTGLKVRGTKRPDRVMTIPHNRFPDALFEA